MNHMEQQPPEGLDRFQELANELYGRQNLAMGIVAGLVAAIVGGVLWAVITVATNFQIGFMAVGVGFLVGYAIRVAGKGLSPTFGYVGAILALFGCLLGNYLTIIGFVAKDADMGVFELLTLIPVDVVIDAMIENFSAIDLLFYGIAIYEGYKLSFTDLSEE